MSTSAGPNIVEDGLVLYLDAANENSYPGTGTTWYDLSFNGYNATLYNSPIHNGHSFVFDGVNEYGTIDSGLKTTIENSTDFTLITLSNIKHIEHVDNLVGWGNANSDGSGYSRTFGQYARGGYLRTSYNGPNFGDSDLLNKDLLFASRYDDHVYYADVLGSVTNSAIADYTGSTSNTWKGISSSYPITIAKTSYYSRYMQVNISIVQMYNRFLSNDEIKQNFNALRGRYGI